MVFLMSDSYLGYIQEYEFTVNVKDVGGDWSEDKEVVLR
jgi:hypothetical protein